MKLDRIYTRGGDAGLTSLGDGTRIPKFHKRIAAMGGLDEANAAIGLALLHIEDAAIRDLLSVVQNDLFDVGADLCCPIAPSKPGGKPDKRLRVSPSQTARLEAAIDEHNNRLTPLNSFVLPGGTPLAAALHMARTVTRRAERATVLLAAREGAGATNPEVVRYLNRLSDLLFVLARVANNDGAADVLWTPGANR